MTAFQIPSDVDTGDYGTPFKTVDDLAYFLIAPDNECGDIGIVQFQVWNGLQYRTMWVQIATNALERIPEVEHCFRKQRNQKNFYVFRLRVFWAMYRQAKLHGLYEDFRRKGEQT